MSTAPITIQVLNALLQLLPTFTCAYVRMLFVTVLSRQRFTLERISRQPLGLHGALLSPTRAYAAVGRLPAAPRNQASHVCSFSQLEVNYASRS